MTTIRVKEYISRGVLETSIYSNRNKLSTSDKHLTPNVLNVLDRCRHVITPLLDEEGVHPKENGLKVVVPRGSHVP